MSKHNAITGTLGCAHLNLVQESIIFQKIKYEEVTNVYFE